MKKCGFPVAALVAGLVFWQWRAHRGDAGAVPLAQTPDAVASVRADPRAKSEEALQTEPKNGILAAGEAMPGQRLPDLELPPGRLHAALDRLDVNARARAVAALRHCRVPAHDYESLGVTSTGALYYICKMIPPATAVADAGVIRATAGGSVSIATPPVKHSRKGAPAVIYLDFNGLTISGTGWNERQATYVALPYDTDGDATTFSAGEQAAITQIWERVSEDYAPFDIDVTTEEPKTFSPTTLRAVITASKDKTGLTMPVPDAAGAAFLDIFGDPEIDLFSPALVYYDKVVGTAAIAEVISHEIGHNLGLSHHGSFVEGAYYSGHGAGETSWAPIMGLGYGRNVTQWSKGEYLNATNPYQDDLAIIGSNIGLRPDEAGSTLATAAVAGIKDNAVSSSGVFTSASDIDVYVFNTKAGKLSFTAKPYRAASGTNGGNVDLKLELLDAKGTVVASDSPAAATSAVISYTAKAGVYFLRVRPVGTGHPTTYPPTGYTSYGSVGQYKLAGTVIAAPPVITGPAELKIGACDPVSYAIGGTNGASLYTATGLPAGLVLNATKGLITGRPKQTGTFIIALTAKNDAGQTAGTLTLTIKPAAPVIVSQSSGLNVVTIGGSLSLKVSALSINGTIRYQWKRNGRPIAGATGATLPLTGLKASDSGYYQIQLSNSTGLRLSKAIFVRVVPKRPQFVSWSGIGTPSLWVQLADGVAWLSQSFYINASGRIMQPTASSDGWERSEAYRGLKNVVAAVTDARDYYKAILTADGEVYFGRSNPRPPAAVAAKLHDVVALAAGHAHLLALRGDGTVLAWGDAPAPFTTVPAGLKKVIAIGANISETSYSVAVKADGTVTEWGVDSFGAQRVWTGGSGIVDASVASATTIAIKADGTMDSWSSGGGISVTPPADLTHVSELAVRGPHAMALTEEGKVAEWGLLRATKPSWLNEVTSIRVNQAGGTALRESAADAVPKISTHPRTQKAREESDVVFTVVADGGTAHLTYQWYKDGKAISGATGATLTLKKIVPASAGQYHVIVTDWLGKATSRKATLTVAPLPVVSAGTATRFVLKAAQSFTLGVKATGTGTLTYQWYHDGRAIAGAATATYQRTAQDGDWGVYWVTVTDAVGVRRSAPFFVLRQRTATDVVTWGKGGLGFTELPGKLSDAIAISIAGSHGLALRSNGTIAIWGIDDDTTAKIPPGLKNVVAVRADSMGYSRVLLADGTAAIWGNSWLGPDYGSDKLTPLGYKDLVAITNYYGLRTDGTVVAWDKVYNTAALAKLRDVVALAGDSRDLIALKADGTVAALDVDRTLTPPAQLANVVAVAKGDAHALALKADGTVVAWGADTGQRTAVPAGLSGVVAIAAAGDYSLALKSDGTVVGWGDSTTGQTQVPAWLNSVWGLIAEARGAGALRDASGDKAPVITRQPASQRVAEQSDAVFTVVAGGGTARLAYQWYKDGKAISGGTGMTLTLRNVALTAAGKYRVIVKDALGSATSVDAVLTVAPLPVITASTATRQVGNAGQSWQFAVTVKGTGAVSYQWYHDGRPIAGANEASYTSAAVAAEAGAYWVAARDEVGMRRSAPFFAVFARTETRVANWSYSNYVPEEASGVVTAIATTEIGGLLLRADGTVKYWGANIDGEGSVPTGLNDIVAVAIGYAHALALKADGTVVSWGAVSSGLAQVPAGLTDVVAIAAVYEMSFALKSDGTIVTWGGAMPVPSSIGPVVAFAVGANHAVGLKADGTVVTWRLTVLGSVPAVPAGLGNVIAVGAGHDFSAALKADGTVVAWGDNAASGRATVPEGLSGVAALGVGLYHTLALKADGTVAAWGDGDYDQIKVPAWLRGVIAVAAGRDQSFAVRDSSGDKAPQIITQPSSVAAVELSDAVFTVVADGGTAPLTYQWKKNGVAIAGATDATLIVRRVTDSSVGAYSVVITDWRGTATSATAPLTLVPLATIKAQSPLRQLVRPGDPLTLAIRASGTGKLRYQWYHDGRLIEGETSATLHYDVSLAEDAGSYWVAVTDDRGTRHGDAFFVLTARTATRVRGWGTNYQQQLAIPETLTTAIAVAAASKGAVALRSDGTVVGWGGSSAGVKTAIPSALQDVVAIEAASDFALALKSDGTVVAWGESGESRLKIPAGLAGVRAIAVGYSHALALRTDGTVVAWGDDLYHRTDVPAGLKDVVAIAAGGYNSYALKADGSIVAWGAYATLPNDTTPLVAIAAGPSHALGLKADGTITAWGWPGPYDTAQPQGVTDVIAIEEGSGQRLVLKRDGSVLIWGDPQNGATEPPADLARVFALSSGDYYSLVIEDRSPLSAAK